jgi:hypothetical protein
MWILIRGYRIAKRGPGSAIAFLGRHYNHSPCRVYYTPVATCPNESRCKVLQNLWMRCRPLVYKEIAKVTHNVLPAQTSGTIKASLFGG